MDSRSCNAYSTTWITSNKFANIEHSQYRLITVTAVVWLPLWEWKNLLGPKIRGEGWASRRRPNGDASIRLVACCGVWAVTHLQRIQGQLGLHHHHHQPPLSNVLASISASGSVGLSTTKSSVWCPGPPLVSALTWSRASLRNDATMRSRANTSGADRTGL